MSKYYKAQVWIDLGEGIPDWPAGEAEYIAWFDYSPGRPGVHTMRNGDPGYPDEPAELIVCDLERNGKSLPVIDEDGDSILTDAQYESVESQCSAMIEAIEAERDSAEYEAWARDTGPKEEA